MSSVDDPPKISDPYTCSMPISIPIDINKRRMSRTTTTLLSPKVQFYFILQA